MKKLSAILLSLMMLVTSNSVAFAAEITHQNVPVVYDNQKLPYKEFSPLQIHHTITKSGYSDAKWVANIEVNRATSNSYLDSSKTTKWPIDVIEAYYRAYRGDALYYSDYDTQYDASFAAAGYDHVAANEIIGQHYFEEEGYQSWQVETYY